MPRRGPILHVLIEKGDWLHFRCSLCSREKVISGHEACYVYGHELDFDELRSLIKARCRVGPVDCPATAGIALPHQIPTVVKAKVP